MTKTKKLKRKKDLSSGLMSLPLIVWVVMFIMLPIAYLFFMSFMTKGALGGVKYIPTIENYTDILEPVYFDIVKSSLTVAGGTTILTVLIGYPFAYYIAAKGPKLSGALLMLLMIPFWANSLVIIYSFVVLFNNTGIINTLLLNIGIIKQPLNLIYNSFAVTVGMVYMLFPFGVMPMYSSIEKLDKGLIEASKDLGANPVKTFFKVTLPLTKPGIFAAVILVFIPSIGYYMITDMLGGGVTMMIGNLIYNQFTSARNWPFGSSLSIILALAIIILMGIYGRLGDMDDLGV